MSIKKITKRLTALAMSLALSVTALVPVAHAAVDNPETVSTQTDQNLDLATQADNVGNVSTKTAETYYESANDALNVNISFSQAPLVSVKTNKDVMVTYTITSDIRLGTIAIDDKTAQDVSSVSANASGKYIYTGTVSVEHNRNVDVKYVTYALKVEATGSHAVTNIDKIAPEFDINNFINGSLIAAKGSTVHDVVDSARINNAVSGIKSIIVSAVPSVGGIAISATSIASTTGTASTTFDDAITSVIGKKSPLVNEYNVTITIVDNAGNSTSTTYNNMTMDGNGGMKDPTASGSDATWNIDLEPDGINNYIQVRLKSISGAPKPKRVLVEQWAEAENVCVATKSVEIVKTYQGTYYAETIVRNPAATKVIVSIDGGTEVSLALETLTGTSPITGLPTAGSSYSGLGFVPVYNAIKSSDSSVRITKKEIRQYTSQADANADSTGTGGTVKTILTCKLPAGDEKFTRVIVTYTQNGLTGRDVSPVFYIQG